MNADSFMEFEPIAITDKNPVPPVASLRKTELQPEESSEFFTIMLLLGPHTAWQKASGSREWEQRESTVIGEKGKRAYPVWRLWRVRHVPTKYLNGLLQRGNDFLADNMVNDKEGGWLNRLLVVLSAEKETNFVPPTMDLSSGFLSMDLVGAAIDQKLNQALARRFASEEPAPGPKTAKVEK